MHIQAIVAMDFVKALVERNMGLVVRKIFDNLDEVDLLRSRRVSNLWKQAIDAEVIAHWSHEKQTDWRWTFGPLKVTKLDYKEHIGGEPVPGAESLCPGPIRLDIRDQLV